MVLNRQKQYAVYHHHFSNGISRLLQSPIIDVGVFPAGWWEIVLTKFADDENVHDDVDDESNEELDQIGYV